MVKLHYFENQRYSKLKPQCEKQEGLFVDPKFPPANRSLYYSKAEPQKAVKWKRPKDICAPNSPRLFVDGMSKHDVTQGILGNCWFVVACSSLALEPTLLEKVIPDRKEQEWDSDNPGSYQGIFKFRFWRQGQWTEVVIDDFLPTIDGKLVYIHSREKNEFWGALVEKAYAKLAGSYEALKAGSISDALVDFTGGVCESIDLRQAKYDEIPESREAFFHSMQKAMDEKSLVGASISVTKNEDMEKLTETGLVMGHAYSVTAVKKISIGEGLFRLFNREQLYMIRLRNPWGQKEWNGPWSDSSEEWQKLKPEQREKLGMHFENDGEFWMSLEDFCKSFTKTTLCHLMNTSRFSLSKRWHLFKHNNEWKPGFTAGGCVANQDTFLKNPQYVFNIKKEGETTIALMQEDTRSERDEGKENLSIGFFIMKVEVNRRYRLHAMMENAGDTIYINSREVVNRFTFKVGRYVVLPTTYDQHEAGRFMLRIFTEKSSNAKLLERNYPVASKIWCCIPRCRTPVCVLSVIVKSAGGLEKRGASLTLDPYAVIMCEGQQVRTPVLYDTVSPKWKAGALFYVRRPQKTNLIVQIWDRNWFRDSFLGQTKTDIDINNKDVIETHQLMGRKSQHQIKMPGTVTMEIRCYHDLAAI